MSLNRSTPLKRTPLARRTGLHARKPLSVAKAKPRRQRDTGPSLKTRLMVVNRDRGLCVRCGRPCGPGIAVYSIQHRVARGVGGGNSLPNLILLCGTATTGCHGEVESRRYPADHENGYRLESWQDPAEVPVTYYGGKAA